MLPDALRSKYQRYKNDTNVVATWLANTSKALGYSTLEPSVSIATAKSGRLKGKARKQAKQQQAPPPVSTSSGNETAKKPNYVIDIKDFVPMAELIATAAEKPFEVPSSIHIALDRVIWVRKTFARQLNRGLGNRKMNATHVFFVNILEKVQEVLKPLLNSDTFNLAELKSSLKHVACFAERRYLGTD